MSINPQHQGHDQFDVLMGSVSSHFAQIDNVLLQNECINGQYQLVTSASYSASCPVTAPGFTRVCISTNGSIIADLENSYITAELKYTLQLNGLDGTKKFTKANIAAVANTSIPKTDFTKYFIGFKQSLDALSRYSIYVNSQEIYTQNFVGQESIVQYAGLNDTLINNTPFTYTSYKNASTMDQNVCGVYIDLADLADANKEFTVTIPVKINLHQFLLLSPIHYLPSFAGRWEIELYFNANNLVICPVNPLSYCNQIIAPIVDNALNVYTTDGNKWKGFSKHFTQLRDKFYAITDAGQDGTSNQIYADAFNKQKFAFAFTELSLQCSQTVVMECRMNITQFQLKYEVYEALMNHYTETPLIIPINLLHYNRFAHQASLDDSVQETEMHATANLPIENCDSIFLLFPNNDTQTTCYYQPYLSGCRLSMGEFGVKPAQYVRTYNDSRFVGLTLDALNLEMSKISAMNKDFSNSIMPHARHYTAAGETYTPTSSRSNPFKQYDDSCFIYGLSCSQVGFQSGTMSSPTSNINFQFDATIDPIQGNASQRKKFAAPMVAMFLQDAEIIIQVVPNSDHPVVRISSKSVV